MIMTDLILDNVYLILLLPFWIFLIIMGGRFFSVYVNKKIIYVLTLLSSFLGILLCGATLIKMPPTIEQSFPFIKINNFILSFGLHIDKLSLIIALVLFLVSFCVQAYSISYMKTEAKSYRFFALLNLFNFSMAGLLFSPNLFQMYAFWELVGVVSYLLIGFEYKKNEKSEASRRVFLVNRVGDTALLGGILAVSYFMYNYAGNFSFTTLDFEDMNAISTLFYAYTSTLQFYLISLLFIASAAVKSAQFPFHIWLQDAMEAKLPVSALLHSATMVVAGVYLVIRLLPMFMLEKNLLIITGAIGLVTALVCSILACIETHPKKVLAYSTSANLGLMFLALGFLNVKAAVIFLVAHAFIKAMLFLCLPKDDEKITYANFITFLVGALSLSGILFSGMVAKELIFAGLEGQTSLAVIFCLVAFFTAFYIIRLALLLVKDRELVKTFAPARFIPAVLLLVMNIVFYFYLKHEVSYKVAEPFWAALAAWGAVYFVYRKGLLTRFTKTPRFVEDFYYKTLPAVYERVASVCSFVDVSIFANYKPLISCAKFKVRVVGWVEENIMNRSVSLTASGAKKISEWDFKLQSRNVQSYNAYGFILITIIISFVIITYTLVLSQLS